MRPEIEYFRQALMDFQEAIKNEESHDEQNQEMIDLLYRNMIECRENIKRLGNVQNPGINKK